MGIQQHDGLWASFAQVITGSSTIRSNLSGHQIWFLGFLDPFFTMPPLDFFYSLHYKNFTCTLYLKLLVQGNHSDTTSRKHTRLQGMLVCNIKSKVDVTRAQQGLERWRRILHYQSFPTCQKAFSASYSPSKRVRNMLVKNNRHETASFTTVAGCDDFSENWVSVYQTAVITAVRLSSADMLWLR